VRPEFKILEKHLFGRERFCRSARFRFDCALDAGGGSSRTRAFVGHASESLSWQSPVSAGDA